MNVSDILATGSGGRNGGELQTLFAVVQMQAVEVQI
jgi:hypothetical protein